MKPVRPPALTSKVSPPQDDCRSVNHSHDRKRAPYNQRAFGSPGLTPTTSRITRWNFRYFEVPQVGASNVVGWSCRCRCCSSNSNVLHLQSLVWIFFFLLLLFPNLSPHQSPLSLSLSLWPANPSYVATNCESSVIPTHMLCQGPWSKARIDEQTGFLTVQ